MRTHSVDGRSRWPLVASIAVVILVITGGSLFALGRSSATNTTAARPNNTAPLTSPMPSQTEASAGGDGDAGAAPTGCLGGNNRDVNMLLSAQKTAPHTAFGAVEVATAFARWSYQFPYPTSAEANTVSAAVIAMDATATFKNLAGIYQGAGNITNGKVPASTPFFLSTTNGLWAVAADSSVDKVTVSVNGSYVINGVLSPTKTAASGFEMVWQKGVWQIETVVQPDVQRLATGGTTFTGGC
jgi:hypothetical protein